MQELQIEGEENICHCGGWKPSISFIALGYETYPKSSLHLQFWLKHWEVQFDPQFSSRPPVIVADGSARSLASPERDCGQGGTLQGVGVGVGVCVYACVCACVCV